MRLAVLSDVHGNYRALEAVLADIGHAADVVVCAGDVAWGGPWPERVIQRLRELGCPCVVGNTDLALTGAAARSHPWGQWAVANMSAQSLAFLEGLSPEFRTRAPGEAAESAGGRGVLVVHSVPGDPARALPHPSQEEGLERVFGAIPAAVVVHGHDHLSAVVRLRTVTVVGTGSVGLPFDGDPRACYAVLEYDAQAGWRAQHRRVAYDAESAAREAEATGMPGVQRWGMAIRRGLPPDRVTV